VQKEKKFAFANHYQCHGMGKSGKVFRRDDSGAA
jgi:hypothetical protein